MSRKKTGRSGVAMIIVICVMALVVALSLSMIYAGSQVYLAALSRVSSVQAEEQAQSLLKVIIAQLQDPEKMNEGLRQYLDVSFAKIAAPDTQKYKDTGECTPVEFALSNSGTLDMAQYGTIKLTLQRLDPVVTKENAESEAVRDPGGESFYSQDETDDYTYLVGYTFDLRLTVQVTRGKQSAEASAILGAQELLEIDYRLYAQKNGEASQPLCELKCTRQEDGSYLLGATDLDMSWPAGSFQWISQSNVLVATLGDNTTLTVNDRSFSSNDGYIFTIEAAGRKDVTTHYVYTMERYE